MTHAYIHTHTHHLPEDLWQGGTLDLNTRSQAVLGLPLEARLGTQIKSAFKQAVNQNFLRWCLGLFWRVLSLLSKLKTGFFHNLRCFTGNWQILHLRNKTPSDAVERFKKLDLPLNYYFYYVTFLPDCYDKERELCTKASPLHKRHC